MKRTLTFLLLTCTCLYSTLVLASHKHKKAEQTDSLSLINDSLINAEEHYITYADSLEKSIKYQHGTIALSNGVATVRIPDGFKYIDEEQSKHILYDLWHNPKEEIGTLGLILPESSSILTDSSFVFNIEYDDMGYVKDDDADKIDYKDLLKDMQKETAENNIERVKLGYQPIDLIGWATTPYYDKDRKILYWAKEVKFGKDSLNTLNYNVRILGRKGVVILNAIATMDQLKKVQANLPKVLDIVSFNDGNKYKDFNPSIDKVAAWTIGGLVAGKILAKVGVLALIVKFWKAIALAIGGGFTAFRKKVGSWFKKKKKDDDDNMPSNVIRPRDNWNS